MIAASTPNDACCCRHATHLLMPENSDDRSSDCSLSLHRSQRALRLVAMDGPARSVAAGCGHDVYVRA
jgi:hypothetical protein